MGWFSGHSENVVHSIIRFAFKPLCGLDFPIVDKKEENIGNGRLEVNEEPVGLESAVEL
jgi:hypothetical protein